MSLSSPRHTRHKYSKITSALQPNPHKQQQNTKTTTTCLTNFEISPTTTTLAVGATPATATSADQH
jgi:hypothetical protein